MSTTGHRDLLAREALAQIPKILTQLDRNPHSPTYGCFDRNYWHYKIIDFPSGMSQEFVWPLALAYSCDIEGNPYYQKPAIRQWCEAAIRYTDRAAHKDASCDDYFPFEKAAGAAAFSLLACVESYVLLGLKDQGMLDFFERRADWLAHHNESGRLTNHYALIILNLERVGSLIHTKKWDGAKETRLAKILSWQSEEGWFPEYEGFDPGYHTLTVSCLARLLEIKPDPRVRTAVERAVRLAERMVHPEGSYGGEYASRNTYNFFPHGFELAGKWMPEALRVNDRFLEGVARGLVPCYADDHLVGHHTWNYLLAWRDWVAQRPAHAERPQGRTHLKEAKILIERRGDTELYLALNKGGSFKLFRGEKLVASDTGVSLTLSEGKKTKNAVCHLVADYENEIGANHVRLAGAMGFAKHKLMTPINLLILRVLMLTVGRFNPDLVRKMLQKVLIVGKKPAPFRFERRVEWRDGKVKVTDTITPEQGWSRVKAAGIGGNQTSIYIVMSRVFQADQMVEWLDLTEQAKKLADIQPLTVTREL